MELKTGISPDTGLITLKIKEIIKKIIKNDRIDHVGDQENFIESLGLSSIQVIMLIAKIETEFNIPFGDSIDDLEAIQSCRQISTMIAQKMNPGGINAPANLAV